MTETAPLAPRANAITESDPAPSDSEVRAHVHGVVEASKTSFLWAMRLLETPRREAM